MTALRYTSIEVFGQEIRLDGRAKRFVVIGTRPNPVQTERGYYFAYARYESSTNDMKKAAGDVRALRRQSFLPLGVMYLVYDRETRLFLEV